MRFDEFHRFVHGGEGQRHNGVGAAVIDRDAPRCGVRERSAGEHHVRHVSHEFVGFVRRQQETVGPVQHAPGLVFIEDGGAHGVGKAVAAREHAVVKHEPALIRFDRRGARAHFGHLPVFLGLHHKTVFAPVGKVFALLDKDIAVGRVAAVARADEQHIFAADLPREEHAVARHGVAGVLELRPVFEIRGIGDADGGAVGREVHPRKHVFPVDLAQARVVAAEDGFLPQVPVDRVFRKAHHQSVVARHHIGAEHARKAAAEGDHRRIEDAVCKIEVIPGDDGVAGVPPHRVFPARGLLLPGDVGQRPADDLSHTFFWSRPQQIFFPDGPAPFRISFNHTGNEKSRNAHFTVEISGKICYLSYIS